MGNQTMTPVAFFFFLDHYDFKNSVVADSSVQCMSSKK